MHEMRRGGDRYPRRQWHGEVLRSTDGAKEIDSERAVMSQLGKRYKCEVCGTEVLCTKAGEGKFVCCDKEMKVQEPKPLPSSD